MPAQPMVAGHSAGGHLALWAAHRLGPDQIGGVLALAPVVGLVAMQRAGVGNGAVADLLGGEPDERSGTIPAGRSGGKSADWCAQSS